MTVYRYKLSALPATVSESAVGAPFVVDSMSFPTYVDIDIASSAKADLDEIMLEAGFVYASTLSGGDPDAASQWALDNPTAEVEASFRVTGLLSVLSAADGAFLVPPGTYQIVDVQLYRRTAGSAGSTIVDVLVGSSGAAATSIYAMASRPTVLASGGNFLQVSAALPDAFTNADLVSGGARIEMDIVSVEAGMPADLSLYLTLKRQS